MSARRRWTDLPPELLATVSGCLHHASDYVRFHAVCKPWRESLPASTALCPVFFPWLVAPPLPLPTSRCSMEMDMKMKLRCVFSKTSYRAVGPARFSGHNWVARADGTAAWLSAFPELTLVDAFSGDVTALPPFMGDDGKTERRMEDSRGVVYGDGTVFLYNFHYNYNSHWDLDDEGEEEEVVEVSTSFREAILPSGDTAWKFVVTFESADLYMYDTFFGNRIFAAYRVYDGKTLVFADGYNWHLLPPSVQGYEGVEEKREMTWEIPEGEVVSTDSCPQSSHVLESRGELLSVCVLTRNSLGQPYEVSVHALEEEVDAHGRHTARWVRRDGQSFADRAMFLGLPTSCFAVEASRFHGGVDDVSGGWVYFLERRLDVHVSGQSQHRVFRYSLLDGKAKFMERLPLELELIDIDRGNNQEFMWLMPQPVIAPIKVIRERLESPTTGGPTLKISISRMEELPKHSKGNFISFNVWNLPPGVDSTRLRRFFNRHGEVSNAEVTSLGKGYVIIAMATSYKPHDVEDALDGLVLDGYTLKVSRATMTTGELCEASVRNMPES